MRVLPYGPSAALLECESTGEVRALAAELARRRPEGLVDVVPGARTVLLSGPAAPAVAREAAGWALSATPEGDAGEVVLAVRWDGQDLADVAVEARLTVAELIATLEGAELHVAFSGFSPGFAYLTGLPPELHVRRLDTPRTAVPAGSVALAGEYAGVYPRASPGGWRLVGTTDAALWDADRDPPALLAPGTRVRLRGAG